MLLAVSSAAVVFAANSVSTLAVAMAFLPVGRAQLPAVTEKDVPRSNLGDGLRYAFARRELLALQAILLTVSAVALGTETLLPVLDRVEWHGGPVAYGMLRAAPGIAAVLTGLGFALRRPARHPVRTLFLSMIGARAGLIAFTLAPALAVAAAGMAFAATGLGARTLIILRYSAMREV